MFESRRFQGSFDFSTLRFLIRQIASPDPKIGIARTGSFRNDSSGLKRMGFETLNFELI